MEIGEKHISSLLKPTNERNSRKEMRRKELIYDSLFTQTFRSENEIIKTEISLPFFPLLKSCNRH